MIRQDFTKGATYAGGSGVDAGVGLGIVTRDGGVATGVVVGIERDVGTTAVEDVITAGDEGEAGGDKGGGDGGG